MHDHLKIAGLILILILGLGVIFYLLNLKSKYRDYSLKWLLYYNAAYNFAILLVLTRKYVEANLSSLVKLPFSFPELAGDIETLFNIFRLSAIIIFIGYLRETDISKLVKRGCLYLEVFVAVLILLKYNFYSTESINLFSSKFIEYLSQLIFYYEAFLLILLFAQNIRREKSLQRSMNISFSVLFIMRYVVFLFFYVIPINIFGYYDKYLQAILINLSVLVFNTMPFIWLKFFYIKYHSAVPQIKPDENNSIFAKHSITGREKEIIRLILDGKTNKEIEAELFLSGHTVKNHIYHIYQKLKINSRFQLVKLFRE